MPDIEKVTKLEPRPKPRVHNSTGFNGLQRRVSALEERMHIVEGTSQTAADMATQAANNTAELIALITTTKKSAAFLKKHGPRIVAFGVGALTISGVDNPKFAAILNLIGKTFF